MVYFPLILLLAGTAPAGPPPQTSLQAAPANLSSARLRAQLKQSAALFRACEYRKAADLLQSGYDESRGGGDPTLAARFLSNLGSCRFALHQYQEALRAFQESRRLAESAGDLETAGGLDVNISSLYLQMGAVDLAVNAAERAMQRLSGTARPKHLPKLLIHLASLRAQQQRMPEAIVLFAEGIAEADLAGDLDTYAQGWTRLGEEYLSRNEFGKAEGPLLEAYRVRKLQHLPALETSYRDLGRLRLAQGDVRSASNLLDLAVEASRKPNGLLPTWDVYHSRGRVHLAEGNLTEALQDLRAAVRLIRLWRRSAPADDVTRVSVDGMLQTVYSALVEASGRRYFETGDRSLAREAFAAAEENRAASLRLIMAETRDWSQSLPAVYWEKLARLQRAEVEFLRHSGEEAARESGRLKSELAEMEAAARSGSALETPKPITAVQAALGPGQALLAFHVGAQQSYLWSISRETFSLERLPGRDVIAGQAERFRDAVRSGDPVAEKLGQELFRLLFGRVKPHFQHKPHWILALDEQLFEIPLAALVVRRYKGAPVYLGTWRSLERVPNAAALAGPHASPEVHFASRPFLGVGDAIYNFADPRWKQPQPQPMAGLFPSRVFAASAQRPGLQLARLPGSAREIESCAREWSAAGPAILLRGAEARKERIRAALELQPAVVHLATHVLYSGQKPRHGLIVLSLSEGQQNELLDPREVASWRMRGGLVVLSGCSSGAADILPGSGLMGLTRAWLAAGAQAVIATPWPAPDDSGVFFRSLYRHLREAPALGPAVALQQARRDMLRSGSWRSSPRFWAGYFLLTNHGS